MRRQSKHHELLAGGAVRSQVTDPVSGGPLKRAPNVLAAFSDRDVAAALQKPARTFRSELPPWRGAWSLTASPRSAPRWRGDSWTVFSAFVPLRRAGPSLTLGARVRWLRPMKFHHAVLSSMPATATTPSTVGRAAE
jgi:hypothetical protein